MQENHADELKSLFTAWSGEEVLELSALPQSGSYREYYHLRGATATAIGVYNADLKENRAFLTFTRHFLGRGRVGARVSGLKRSMETSGRQ